MSLQVATIPPPAPSPGLYTPSSATGFQSPHYSHFTLTQRDTHLFRNKLAAVSSYNLKPEMEASVNYGSSYGASYGSNSVNLGDRYAGFEDVVLDIASTPSLTYSTHQSHASTSSLTNSVRSLTSTNSAAPYISHSHSNSYDSLHSDSDTAAGGVGQYLKSLPHFHPPRYSRRLHKVLERRGKRLDLDLSRPGSSRESEASGFSDCFSDSQEYSDSECDLEDLEGQEEVEQPQSRWGLANLLGRTKGGRYGRIGRQRTTQGVGRKVMEVVTDERVVLAALTATFVGVVVVGGFVLAGLIVRSQL
ncbi:hypothetical protein BJ508DRAFT_333039 [Ascobolus immersus RN42]|uniref:Uncharacterized protein n=1 Tax=Ascobolus immersus RN42 TaxID=1160509 RepID=A0A3N4HKV5_ASCIM|nr:hypothetical protein BJ508DRAFT_333039 [Ascobolus immersus RN42]